MLVDWFLLFQPPQPAPGLKESDITSRVSSLLFDTANTRWPIAELRQWLNDGQREIVNERPDASAVTSAIALVPGVLQSLPPTAIRLLDVTRNLGTDGLTPGRSVKICEMETIAQYSPNWPSDTPSATVQNFMYDERYPLEFYVYPPVPASPAVFVEIINTSLPIDSMGPADPLYVGDWYSNALIDYVMYRALSKNTLAGSLSQAAQAHLAAFDRAIGRKTLSDYRTSPNTADDGGAKPRSAGA